MKREKLKMNKEKSEEKKTLDKKLKERFDRKQTFFFAFLKMDFGRTRKGFFFSFFFHHIKEKCLFLKVFVNI